MKNQIGETPDTNRILESIGKHVEKTVALAFQKVFNTHEQGFFSIKHAAQYCDLSEKSVRRLVTAGKLTAYRPARGKVLIKKQELDAFIEQSTTPIRKGRGIRR